MKHLNLILLVSMLLLSKSRSFPLVKNLSTLHLSIARLTQHATTSSDEKEQENNNIHTVQWQTSDGLAEFHARDGETLRTAALRRGVVSPHNGRARLINCRGLGTCGTCAVEVEDMASVYPPERNSVERARLNFPPHGGENQSPNLRLSCQVQVRGNVVVTKRTGFWGQYNEIAKASAAETYFGDLEFVLDRKSPPADDSMGDKSRRN